MKNKKRISAILLAFVMCLSFVFVGCSNKSEAEKQEEKKSEVAESAGKIDKIKKAGKLVLGTCADYPPYEFQKVINGKNEIVGFDIEIAKEIAKDLGVQLEIKDMDFDGLIPSLKTGKVDMVISGMTPNPKRLEEVDFSKLYYKAVQSVVIRKEDEGKFDTVEKLSQVRVGAQTSSIQEEIAKEEIKSTKVVSLGKVTELILSLKTKKVDAVVVEYPVAKAYVDKNSELMISKVKVGDEDAGSAIGIQKGNQDLVDAVNKTIDRLISEDKINKFVSEASALSE